MEQVVNILLDLLIRFIQYLLIACLSTSIRRLAKTPRRWEKLGSLWRRNSRNRIASISNQVAETLPNRKVRNLTCGTISQHIGGKEMERKKSIMQQMWDEVARLIVDSRERKTIEKAAQIILKNDLYEALFVELISAEDAKKILALCTDKLEKGGVFNG